jgi:hypothetical protein
MRKWWLVIGIVLLALACSLTDGGNGEATTVAVEPEENGGSAAQGEIAITVENLTSEDICYIQISASDDESWGEDRLGSSEVISAGSKKVFSFPEGMYDVRISNCDEAVMATAWEVSRDTVVAVGQGGGASVKIENQSSYEICYVYISPTSSDSWNEDWLGMGETIRPDRERIFYVDSGTYDLMVENCDQEELTREEGVTLSEGETAWTISD